MKPPETSTVVIEDSDEDLAAGAEVGTTTAAVVVDDEAEAKKTTLPARAVANADGSVTLPLLQSVKLTVKTGRGMTEETYSELVFHEMKGIDLRLIAQAPEAKQTIVALARALRISTPRMDALFDQMKAKDVTAAVAVITFLQE